MCFDVPWKADRLRLRCYGREHMAQKSLCSLVCIGFVYDQFLTLFAASLETVSFEKQQTVSRMCLQAALYFTRNSRGDWNDENATQTQRTIMEMSRRFNEMQIALLEQVLHETGNDSEYFAREMQQVSPIFNTKFALCEVCIFFKKPNVSLVGKHRRSNFDDHCSP